MHLQNGRLDSLQFNLNAKEKDWNLILKEMNREKLIKYRLISCLLEDIKNIWNAGKEKVSHCLEFHLKLVLNPSSVI